MPGPADAAWWFEPVNRNEENFLHLMEFIEASEYPGASFDFSGRECSFHALPSDRDPRKRRENARKIPSVELHQLLREMRDKGLVKGDFTKNSVLNVRLVPHGRVWLQEQRKNRFLFRAWRWLARQIDRVFSLIFLPVVAAVLTVWALNYFGLNDLGKTLPTADLKEDSLPFS